MGKLSTFEIISGSYEEFLLGYIFSSKENSLTQSFAAHDHAASIRCVALSGHYLASGGADDRIFVYDLKARKEHCSLTYHNATINCLEFTENHSHLISGSSDGVLVIVRVGNWQVEKIWEKAHKGFAILDIAIHSSGKLALTLGADCTLVTWNLIKGRQAYTINLNSKSKDAKSLEKILWGPDGVRFLLYGGKYTEIWNIESGGIVNSIQYDEKVTSCVWLSDSLLAVGLENGQICTVDLENNDRELIQAHESRIKSIVCYKKWIISICSSGRIKVWNKKFEEQAMVDTGCRLTCLCVVPPIKVKNEESVDADEIIIDEHLEAVKEKKISKPQVEVVIEEDDEDMTRKLKGKNSKTKRDLKIQSEVKKSKKKKI